MSPISFEITTTKKFGGPLEGVSGIESSDRNTRKLTGTGVRFNLPETLGQQIPYISDFLKKDGRQGSCYKDIELGAAVASALFVWGEGLIDVSREKQGTATRVRVTGPGENGDEVDMVLAISPDKFGIRAGLGQRLAELLEK